MRYVTTGVVRGFAFLPGPEIEIYAVCELFSVRGQATMDSLGSQTYRARTILQWQGGQPHYTAPLPNNQPHYTAPLPGGHAIHTRLKDAMSSYLGQVREMVRGLECSPKVREVLALRAIEPIE